MVTTMPPIKNLECSRCNSTFSAERPQTLCPKCQGALYVRYDLRPLHGAAVRDAAMSTRSCDALGRHVALPRRASLRRPRHTGRRLDSHASQPPPSRNFSQRRRRQSHRHLQSARTRPRRHHGSPLRLCKNWRSLLQETQPALSPPTPPLPASKPTSSCRKTSPSPITSRP